MTHKARIETPEGRRRLARRIFAHRCTRYGVTAFDWPTFNAIYPLHARAIQRLLGVAVPFIPWAMRPEYDTALTVVEQREA